MSATVKAKKWFNPMIELNDDGPQKRNKKENPKNSHCVPSNQFQLSKDHGSIDILTNVGSKNWIKNFDPTCVEDLAVNVKKIQEVEEWLNLVKNCNCSDILLITGPVGCGKTATLHTLATKHGIKVTEWITPLDIDMPTEYGDFEFKVKQSKSFLEFILNVANFTSLLDNNNNKLVLVEDFPNTFLRTPSEFSEVLHQYKTRAKSPIVFICSESHTDSKNTAANLFTPSLKEQFGIHHVSFNSVSATGLKAALKRVSEIISRKHTAVYNVPTSDMIECVVNSSAGDVRSAVLNLHFACLKGSKLCMETSLMEKETKTKTTTKRKRHTSSKFMSLGKDQTVSILHGVGRVLNPKIVVKETGQNKLSHSPEDIIEQFITQPISFVNFLQENYLPHFSIIDHAEKAASALSDADFMLAEWREKMVQEYGLYTAVAGLMLSNKAPVSAWNPVRGPKNMRIQYPSPKEMALLEPDTLYKGRILVSDYQTYCKIIGSKTQYNLID